MVFRSPYQETQTNKLQFITKDWCRLLLHPESILLSHKNSVQCVQYNPQKNTELFSAGHDCLVKRWDLQKMLCVDNYQWKE
jgi:hypothetical protein